MQASLFSTRRAASPARRKTQDVLAEAQFGLFDFGIVELPASESQAVGAVVVLAGTPAEPLQAGAPLRSEAAEHTAAPAASRNYRIIPADQLGQGGLRQTAEDNLRAVRLLAALRAEGPGATPEEQRVLVRYVGWGALP